MPNILNSTELLFHIRNKNGIKENKLKEEIKTLRQLTNSDINMSINRAIKKGIIKRTGKDVKPSSKIKYLR